MDCTRSVPPLNSLILATHNAGKIQELTAALRPIHCVLLTELSQEEPAETGLSFVENAILKARHASALGNAPALADDSGLVVDALHGEPGIYSARFAAMKGHQDHNVDALLDCMKTIQDAARVAYFYCAIALVRHATDPMPIIATGQWAGFITHEKQGTAGFGYDPVFYLPALRCTAAQLSLDQKNKISHRAIALNALKQALAAMA